MLFLNHHSEINWKARYRYSGALLAVLLFFLSANGQQHGLMSLIQPVQLDSLIELSKRPAFNKIEGFRIQIFMESGNMAVNHAQETIATFNNAFPDIPAYLSFGQPYYRVRVGNFRTRLEAESQLRYIAMTYPKAFVIKETIEPPALYPSTINNTGP
ncbi:MAG: SPOR domain-containing protein [Bacteroidales bacterium]|nr:SPOR domain-containing protein [Bacteroidales bacterium]